MKNEQNSFHALLLSITFSPGSGEISESVRKFIGEADRLSYKVDNDYLLCDRELHLFYTNRLYDPDWFTLSSFSNNGFDPVKLSVDKSQDGTLKFIATNETFYPFTVKIDFRKMDNFTTAYRTIESFVKYGKNFLFDLKVRDPESGYNLDYNFSYTLGRPEAVNETDLVYLVPLKPGSVPVSGKAG